MFHLLLVNLIAGGLPSMPLQIKHLITFINKLIWVVAGVRNHRKISILLSSVLYPVSDSNYIIFLRLIITVEEQFEHNMPFWNKLANRVRGDVMFLSITSMEHRIRKIAALCTFLLHPYYNTSLRYLQLAKIENIFISLQVLLSFYP